MVEAGRQAKKIGLAEFSAALLLGVREPLGRDSVATGFVLVADSWKFLLSRLPMIPAGRETRFADYLQQRARAVLGKVVVPKSCDALAFPS